MAKIFKVKYSGEMNEKLDEAIRKLAESNGYEWCGQGYNSIKNERDISFSKID